MVGSILFFLVCFFFSSRRRHTRLQGDWSSDVCSSDLVVSVGPTKWTVCYKVHVIPSRRTQYKASITLWPRTRQNRARPGWHPHLVKSNWYQACLREPRRYGYHGNWLSSPYGRFGDFWKPLRDFSALARETRFQE